MSGSHPLGSIAPRAPQLPADAAVTFLNDGLQRLTALKALQPAQPELFNMNGAGVGASPTGS